MISLDIFAEEKSFLNWPENLPLKYLAVEIPCILLYLYDNYHFVILLFYMCVCVCVCVCAKIVTSREIKRIKVTIFILDFIYYKKFDRILIISQALKTNNYIHVINK